MCYWFIEKEKSWLSILTEYLCQVMSGFFLSNMFKTDSCWPKEYTNTHTQSHMCEMNVEEKWKESSSRCEKPEGGDLVGFTRKLSFSSASLVNYIVRNPIRVFTVHWTPPFVSTSSVSVCVLRDSIHNPFKQFFLFGFSPGH